jgi:hypothetical protein
MEERIKQGVQCWPNGPRRPRKYTIPISGKVRDTEKVVTDAHSLVDLYARAGVTELFLCVNAMCVSYDNRVWEPMWVGYRFKEWPDKALDFGREDVRKRALALIREIAELYDMDGLELDWMHFGFHFRPGFEQAGAPLLTAFIREARKIQDTAEQKRGHRIQLSARVPSRPETSLGLGMDAVAWARECLIDLLVVTPFWATAETDMPIEIWKQLLWGTGTKLAAGLELLLRPYNDIIKLVPNISHVNLLNSIETVRGMAWSYIHRGVDAVYLFN